MTVNISVGRLGAKVSDGSFTNFGLNPKQPPPQEFLTNEALTEIARVTIENILRLQNGQPYLEGTTL